MSTAPPDWPITLALDTAGPYWSLFLRDREGLYEVHRIEAAGRRNAKTLILEAVALCARHGLTLGEIGLVCVSTGPGSFTGLRVGVTFAKTLAFAAGCAAVGVPSHLTVRRVTSAGDPPGTVLRVVSDALRGEFYRTDVTIGPPGELPAADGPRLVPTVDGPGELVRCGEDPGGAADAFTVGAVGLSRWRAGRTDDPFGLVPLYVRRSSAEEKADPI